MLAKIIGDLHGQWRPHDGQKAIIRKIFGEGALCVMSEWGRKGGKTETIEYFLTRGALTKGRGWYYFAPEQKQAKEIVWASGRLQRFVPRQYVDSINNTEMRITLTNGSFIKVDGSDNFESYRGIEPGGAAYDEFKDFRPEFHPAFSPNFAVFRAPLLICGTVPETDVEHYDSMRTEMASHGCLFNFPTWVNPHIDRAWLKAEKAALYRRGDGDQWEREYAAKKVRGGRNAIFPMFSAAKHVKPHKAVMEELYRDRKKLLWQCIADPGNATVFGVLFRVINPYTRHVYRIAEIYETNQAETSTSRIVPRARQMRAELFPDAEACGVEWELLYDEAATWFATEALNSFGESWTPTAKGTRDIDQGLSLIKDQMLYGLTTISDRCSNLTKEIQNFIRDPRTGRPRKDCSDHLIDCDRYGNDFAGIDLSPEQEPENLDADSQARFRTPEQDMAAEGDDDFGALDDF